MQRIVKLAISVLVCFSSSFTKAEESHKVIVVALAMHKSRTLSLDESDFIARLYMHALTNVNNYPVIVVYEGEGNECALNDYDIKVDIFARKDRFKSLEVYGLTTIIFDKSALLDGLKPLGLTDDQLKILTADKSHQISAGNIVLWSTAFAQ